MVHSATVSPSPAHSPPRAASQPSRILPSERPHSAAALLDGASIPRTISPPPAGS
ncbi:MAG: hypothetical protein LBQ79_08430 [Deltaproteobacteria bacterium]|nr:hypothetical protein [Deltaproteobacteria bacterium]